MGTLVLSRKEGESINIGPDVVVKIQRVQGRSAKVLIFAPDDIEILRTELAPQYMIMLIYLSLARTSSVLSRVKHSASLC